MGRKRRKRTNSQALQLYQGNQYHINQCVEPGFREYQNIYDNPERGRHTYSRGYNKQWSIDIYDDNNDYSHTETFYKGKSATFRYRNGRKSVTYKQYFHSKKS